MSKSSGEAVFKRCSWDISDLLIFCCKILSFAGVVLFIGGGQVGLLHIGILVTNQGVVGASELGLSSCVSAPGRAF